MTTPEGPYRLREFHLGPSRRGVTCFIEYGAEEDLTSYHAITARLNQQHAEIERLRDEVATYRLALANALGIPRGPGFLAREATE